MLEKAVVIHTEGEDIIHNWKGNITTIKIPSPRLGSPDDPYLYTFTLTDGTDKI